MRSPLDIWTIITGITEANQTKLIEGRVQSRRLGVNGGPVEQIRAKVEAVVNAKTQLGNMYETLLHLSKVNGASAETIQDFELKLLNYWYKRIPAIQDKNEVHCNGLYILPILMISIFDHSHIQTLCNSLIRSSKLESMIRYHGKCSSTQQMQRMSVCNAYA